MFPSFPKPIFWLGMEKQNLTQHSPIKTNVTQHRINTKKLNPGLVASYNIRPGNGEGLFLFQSFINFSSLPTLTHLLTAPDPQRADSCTDYFATDALADAQTNSISVLKATVYMKKSFRYPCLSSTSVLPAPSWQLELQRCTLYFRTSSVCFLTWTQLKCQTVACWCS